MRRADLKPHKKTRTTQYSLKRGPGQGPPGHVVDVVSGPVLVALHTERHHILGVEQVRHGEVVQPLLHLRVPHLLLLGVHLSHLVVLLEHAGLVAGPEFYPEKEEEAERFREYEYDGEQQGTSGR